MIVENISIKILTVGESYKFPQGGISSLLRIYSKNFKQFKFVATYNTLLNKYLNILFYIKALFCLLYLLSVDRKIRIVHIHGCYSGSFYRKYIVFLVSKYLFRKTIIYHSHGSQFENFYISSNSLIKYLIKNFLSNVDLIICLSANWKEFFKSTFKLKNIEIVENIIEPPVTDITKEEKEVIQILFLGLIGKRKGIFDLIKTIGTNRFFFENRIKLIIAGNGDINNLKKMISQYQLESIVQYVGWVGKEEKIRLLIDSDLYILPSYYEGLPISILEAMSYGLPVISTSVGGIGEIVKDNINGFLIEPGDEIGLFEKIKYFILNPQQLIAMGRCSKNFVQPYYVDAVIPKLEKIYKSLLSN